MSWRENPAGNLSRGFKLQVNVTAWKNKPRYEKTPVFNYRFEDCLALPSYYCYLWHELVWFSCFLQSLVCKIHVRDSASIPKDTGRLCSIRLLIPLSSPHAMRVYELQSSKPTAVTPEHLLGRYWFLLLSLSFPDSNKETKIQQKRKIQWALLWVHTWDSCSLKWDVCLCISEAIIRSFSYCEMSLYCRALIQSQIWMQTLKLCKSKSFVLVYYSTRRLLEGFQNLEVFEARSCLLWYWWCWRRKGELCFWMAPYFPFYLWLEAEMLCRATKTSFTFNSISRWDIAPPQNTEKKATKLFQPPKDFQVQFKALTKILGHFWFYPTLFAQP